MWDLSSLPRNWACILCFVRWILNHWTTKEVSGKCFFCQSFLLKSVAYWDLQNLKSHVSITTTLTLHFHSLSPMLNHLGAKSCHWQNRDEASRRKCKGGKARSSHPAHLTKLCWWGCGAGRKGTRSQGLDLLMIEVEVHEGTTEWNYSRKYFKTRKGLGLLP